MTVHAVVIVRSCFICDCFFIFLLFRPEKQRRTEMQNWSAFIKVLFNGKEVSRTIVK